MEWQNLFLLVFSLYVSICYGRTLTEILSRYDTLNKADIQHRIFRRSLDDIHGRSIDFISNGKHFHMNLVQSKEIFDPSFEAVSIDGEGNEKPVYINMDSFYKGYIDNDPSSHVTAHLEDDGMLTATIETANNTYVVEPMWRHVDNNPSHDMIVYKASDLKWNFTNLDNVQGGEPHINICGNNNTATEEHDEKTYKRFRRAAVNCAEYEKANNTCKLMLVADYEFFKEIGRSHVQTAIHYMVQVINHVNGIYRGTCWDGVGKGIGVQVEKVKVHIGYSNIRHTAYAKKKDWNIDGLLTEFSRSDWSNVCLAHLFTYQDFEHGVIGLAYVASKNSRVGGMCSPPSRDARGQRYHNCGLTTYINWRRRLTTLEATLVTAHEIGHNFGANHDSVTCSPNGENGNYVMYSTSVTGEKSNNKKFSGCSRAQIGGVLKARTKWKNCLKKLGGSQCPNGIVEKDYGEECDEGRSNANDPCCKNCKLRKEKNAKCSDINSLCCKNCTFAKADKVCRKSFALECDGETTCNGISADCPKEAPKLKSGSCHLSSFGLGECNATGSCTSLCKLKANLESCSCPYGSNACKVCCRNNASNECVPYLHGGKTKYESDGVQCHVSKGRLEGLCEGGKCRNIRQNIKDIDTFKDLLTDFSFSKAVRFMENNIVLTILIFSLLLWIPAGCIVNQIDKSEERKLYQREMSKDQFAAYAVTKEPKVAFKKNGENLRVRTGQHVGM